LSPGSLPTIPFKQKTSWDLLKRRLS